MAGVSCVWLVAAGCMRWLGMACSSEVQCCPRGCVCLDTMTSVGDIGEWVQ